MCNQFAPKDPSEQIFLKFDFSFWLSPAETISSAVVTSIVQSGTDASPSAMISGPATINNSVASQLVIGGVDGTTYRLKCTVVTSLGQTFVLAGLIQVELNITGCQ